MKIGVRGIGLLGAMLLLDGLEGVIHWKYGWGCWGFQPGGGFSMLVLTGLACLFFAAILLALPSQDKRFRLQERILVILGALIVVGGTFLFIGCRAFTSVHNQGPENLWMLGALNVGIVLVVLASMSKQDAT